MTLKFFVIVNIHDFLHYYRLCYEYILIDASFFSCRESTRGMQKSKHWTQKERRFFLVECLLQSDLVNQLCDEQNVPGPKVPAMTSMTFYFF